MSLLDWISSIFWDIVTVWNVFKLNFLNPDLTKPIHIQATKYPKKNPILLVHGSSGNQFEWFPSISNIQHYLPNHDVFAFSMDLDFDPKTFSYVNVPTSLLNMKYTSTKLDLHIEDYVQHLSKIIDYVLNRTHSDKVILIGQSMGGLTSLKCACEKNNSNKISDIICISSPLQGTPHMLNPLIKSILTYKRHQQMTPNSQFISTLNNDTKNLEKIRMLTFGSPQDIHVPSNYARLHNVEHVEINGVGHLSISKHEKVWEKIAAFLQYV